jgi:hypothetical protein
MSYLDDGLNVAGDNNACASTIKSTSTITNDHDAIDEALWTKPQTAT